MRRAWRGLLRCAVVFIAAGLVYFVSAILLGFMPGRATPPDGTPQSYRYYACDNGVHVDLVLPVRGGGRDWFALFPPRDFAGDVTAASHLALGWGARNFFATTPHWRYMRPIPVLKALFWLDRSVLHVSYHGDPAGRANCRALTADRGQTAALFSHIDASLRLAAGMPVREELPGYGPHDAFYTANGRYSLFRTCNVWSADGLETAGNPISIWSPFSFQLLLALDRNVMLIK